MRPQNATGPASMAGPAGPPGFAARVEKHSHQL